MSLVFPVSSYVVFSIPCPPFSFKKDEVFSGVAFVSYLARKLGGSIASCDNMRVFFVIFYENKKTKHKVLL